MPSPRAPVHRLGRPWLRVPLLRTALLLFLVCSLGVLNGAAAPAVSRAAGMTLPLANWEVLSSSGPSLTIAGWAMDPDQRTAAVPVHVYIDGGGTALTANASRPDVGAAFPGAGNAHGFSWSAPVSPGVHTVCVYAIDVDAPSRNQPLGCRSIGVRVALPSANWEVLSSLGSNVTVAGWAMDPDEPTAAVPVHVYVDGVIAAYGSAGGFRPDVGAAFPGAGSMHGFSWSLPVSRGTHTVCVYAIDVDVASRNQPLGCRSIGVGVRPPLASWDVLSGDESYIRVIGWAMDPDRPTTPVNVRMKIDGQWAHLLIAEHYRPDVGAAFPGAGDLHGFNLGVPHSAGEHTVCLVADDDGLDPNRSTSLGCRTVTLGMTMPQGNWEGVSAALSTISVVGWVFDADSPWDPVQVQMRVDGALTAVTANGNRPDVGAAFSGVGITGVGPNHGFTASVPSTPGVHQVCVSAVDRNLAGRTADFGCRTVTVPVLTPAEDIEATWTGSGGAAGPLGSPLGPVDSGLLRGGHRQSFQNGDIYWSATTGARMVLSGALRDDWILRGAHGGELGYPTDDTVCGLVDSGCRQDFEGGALYDSAATDVALVSGRFLTAWRGSAQDGYLGYPLADAECGLRDGGCMQEFQKGVLTWSPTTPVLGVTGPVLLAWVDEGAEEGPLGYPVQSSRFSGSWHSMKFQYGEIEATQDPWSGQLTYTVTMY